MSHQHCTLGDVIYFWFAANDTAGSGADGSAAQYVVREGGDTNSAVPVASGIPALLTNANYPAGCYEITIDTDGTFSYTGGLTYGVFCTLAVDSQNPTGFVGSFAIDPIPAHIVSAEDSAARQIQGALGSGTIATILSTTSIEVTEGYDGSLLVGQVLIMIENGGIRHNSRTITGGSTGTILFTPSVDGWEANGDYYVIVPSSGYIKDIKDMSDVMSHMVSNADDVFLVGPSETYTTIAAAEAVATSGDMIIVLPGTYTTQIGKNGVMYNLLKGVTVTAPTEVDLIPGTITNLTILGRGVLNTAATADNNCIYTGNAGVNVKIEADQINITNSCWGFYANSGYISVKSRSITMDSGSSMIAETLGSIISLDIDHITTSSTSYLVALHNTGTVMLNSKYIEYASSVSPVSGAAGTFIFNGHMKFTHASTTGLSAGSGTTIMTTSGSITVPTGRPSIAGAAKFVIAPAFGYDVDAVTATDITVVTGTAESITGGQTYTKSTVNLGTSASSFTGQSTDLSSTDDFYVGGALTFTSGALKGQTRPITNYVGSLNRFTVYPAFPSAPTSGDGLTIMGYFNL